MTKSELRRARRLARASGEKLTGELVITRLREAGDGPAMEFSETPRGYRARERWAKHYYNRNGAPEGDWDR